LAAGTAGVTAALVGLTACATSPVPNERIAVAQVSVQRAEQSGAQELAPVELSTARDKLQNAERAAANHAPGPATMLAEQANVDAQLAEATAQEHRSHEAAMQLDASLQALRQEAVHAAPPPLPSSPTVAAPQPPTE
jgi:glutathione synthase/RimK-type ligase-like ATP-grasp enzyme